MILVWCIVGLGPDAGAQEPAPSPAGGEGQAPAWMVQPSMAAGAEPRTYFVYDLEPGDRIEDSIGIVNHSGSDLTLAVFGSDAFNNADTGAFDLLPTVEAPRDVGSWVALAAGEVTVPARSRVDVPFVLSVPANATPGDHTGGVVTSFRSSGLDEQGQQLVFDARIAVRIYLTVGGELSPSLAIADLSSSFAPSSNQLTGAVTVSYTVVNDGNLRLGATERVRVAGPFGVAGRVVTGAVDELLPGSRLRRTVVVEGVPALFATSAEVTLEPVDAAQRVEPGSLPPVVGSTTMATVPWVALAVVVGGTTVVVVVGRRRRRRWRELKAQVAASIAEPASPPTAAAMVGTEGSIATPSSSE